MLDKTKIKIYVYEFFGYFFLSIWILLLYYDQLLKSVFVINNIVISQLFNLLLSILSVLIGIFLIRKAKKLLSTTNIK